MAWKRRKRFWARERETLGSSSGVVRMLLAVGLVSGASLEFISGDKFCLSGSEFLCEGVEPAELLSMGSTGATKR